MPSTRQHGSTKKPQGEGATGSARPQETSASAQRAPDPVRVLQQSLGNQGVLRRMESGLRINDVNDPAEREADRVADRVMSAPHSQRAAAHSVSASGSSPGIQRKCASCAEEDEEVKIQRKESSASSVAVATGPSVTAPSIVNQVLNSPGQPLDANTRGFMEERFGHDFGNVRIHTDERAAESAHLVNATAYTVGQNVVFSPGRYAPQSIPGQKLLAHELTHVVQQRRGGAIEQDAGNAAAHFEGSDPISVKESSAPGIARQEADDLPWWKERLNPLYQGALKVLPKEAAEKLKQANAVAKKFIQDTGVTNEGLNQAVQTAEPVLKPIADYLGVKASPPPPPKKEDKKPTVWVGQPPIDVRLKQRREQKAAQAALDKTEPGSLAPPVHDRDALDLPALNVLLKPDPPSTDFETKLHSGKKFAHTLTPRADLRPSQAIWLGHRPRESEIDNVQFTPVGDLPPSTKIWEHDRPFDIYISGDDVTPIRDSKTHALKGYRLHLGGETLGELNRDGQLVSSQGTERPLETPVVDPIDLALIFADLGPLAAKGIQAGGKALFKTVAKSGARDLGELGSEEASKLAGRDAMDVLESGHSHPQNFPEIDLGVSPTKDAPLLTEGREPFYTPTTRQLTQGVVADESRVPGSAAATSIGELNEPILIRQFHPNAVQMPPRRPGFDAFEGGQIRDFVTTETPKSGPLKGTPLTVVNYEIKGGNAISFKTVFEATPKNVRKNVQEAMEKAENALTKWKNAPRPVSSTVDEYYLRVNIAPDQITVHIAFNNAAVTEELLIAAQEQLKAGLSTWPADFPPVHLLMTGK